MLNTPVNGKIQGFYKAFECFSSTFQGKFNFQGLFKTVLYIQVLVKPVRTLVKTVDASPWIIWAVTRQKLSSGFPIKQDLNQSSQLQD